MKKLVVYDSVFGNTEQVARAVGQALGGQVEVLAVSQVTPQHLSGLGLLLVGSPTRGFRPTPAITEWLKAIPDQALRGVPAGAFDTRIATQDISPRIFRGIVALGGYAAKPIAAGLQKKGARLAAPPEGFYVAASEGPLKSGELERAAAWARACDSQS